MVARNSLGYTAVTASTTSAAGSTDRTTHRRLRPSLRAIARTRPIAIASVGWRISDARSTNSQPAHNATARSCFTPYVSNAMDIIPSEKFGMSDMNVFDNETNTGLTRSKPEIAIAAGRDSPAVRAVR